MSNKRKILNKKQINIIIKRLCHELIENHNDFSDTVIVSLLPRGKHVARRIVNRLEQILEYKINYGELDISFYRDDLRRHSEPIIPHKMEMNVSVDEKHVVIIDDVLYTGRSVRSAIDALMPFGRPKSIELLVFVDRRLSRHLPIQPDYVGKIVDSIDSEKVVVNITNDGDDNILILKS
ncbi:MAG: bifunctional pyr operon transcriptional regulator/uracil phosphoribosyltransferase PyrR [Flavobacteriales bacterium]|jgi:pyrimidine operon attenuation protein / uracil phosphoribosyltransferase|nr:bifunctional pyr operon transcriptional regulator/uracil phosphoribosyltransferase PyrR [Flavobacteriales bacterium]